MNISGTMDVGTVIYAHLVVCLYHLAGVITNTTGVAHSFGLRLLNLCPSTPFCEFIVSVIKSIGSINVKLLTIAKGIQQSFRNLLHLLIITVK
jgi:hypothetical protein